jgi:hypothetical protein
MALLLSKGRKRRSKNHPNKKSRTKKCRGRRSKNTRCRKTVRGGGPKPDIPLTISKFYSNYIKCKNEKGDPLNLYYEHLDGKIMLEAGCEPVKECNWFQQNKMNIEIRATKAYYAIKNVFPDKEDAIIIELIRQKILPNVTIYVPLLVEKEKLTDYWLRKTNKTYNEYIKLDDSADKKSEDDQTDDDNSEGDGDPWSEGRENVTYLSPSYGKSKKEKHPHPAFHSRKK